MNRERLKDRRKALGLTLQEVADKMGLTRATVQRYESGLIKGVETGVLERLSEVLACTPAYLMGWTDEPENLLAPTVTADTTLFPVIGEIAAGYDHIASEDFSGEKIEIPNSYLCGRKPEEFFVLKVQGESMYPTYQEGDKVLILKQSTLNYSGQIGAILYDNTCATLKKVEYAEGEDWLRLVPVNPAFPPVKIEREDLERCRVLGVPRLVIREV